MPRRIVSSQHYSHLHPEYANICAKTRALVQAAAFISLVFVLVWFADSRYRLLPDAIHSALPSHHAGTVITDVTISFCSSINPLSSCRLDPDKWHRVEKDLYLQAGWLSSAWLHVQRKKEEELTSDDKVVVDLKISRLDPGMGEAGQDNERWEGRPGGIWILRSAKRHESDSHKAITVVDILFGADAVDPRPNWNLVQTPLLVEGGSSLPSARLSFRHGQASTKHESFPVPRVSKEGKFKILQISDSHLSTGTGVCRDAIGPDGRAPTKCEADPRTLEFLEKILDDEKPHLVVLSGDQVEGPAAPDTQTALFKMVAPLIDRSIPYAAIFGNHDDEGPSSLSRAAQMGLLQALPLSLSQPGPEFVEGMGNYYVEVLAASSQHSAITLYMLDTHSLSQDEKRYEGYDWLKKSQIDWFHSTVESLRSNHQKYSHIHMDMAFIHIPLPEYGDTTNIVTGGHWKEGVTAPKYNSHFYDALVNHSIMAVGCGHDHVNDYCALRPHQHDTDPKTPKTPSHTDAKKRLGPWMCYAGGSGFGGYAGYGGFHRRVRVWEIDTNAGRMMTWKRVECCGEDTKKKIDEMVLVEGGHVVAPS